MVEEIVKEIKAFCRNKDVSMMDLREKFDTCYKLVKEGYHKADDSNQNISQNSNDAVSVFCFY